MNINITSATSIITDENFHESISHGNQSFPFSYYYKDIWSFDFHCIDWHWHHEVEFVTVLSGTAFCLIQYRLSCAARLLSTTKNPVSSIAEETGFSSSGYFCRKFKERYHMSPNSYRKQMNALL